ncbi:Cullin protein neddylation domain [Musa troglodytarum]|uniref:Cullin protein neddylation domain n=1 Tax=Musa troglodytarum TaxID=320322 RepID=A0A9E7E7P8_9LILI|nr:Cullin protein neddylation domain [Musa troglodytarum]
MCILMLFNSADRLTYREIKQATQIPASDLKRCLQSLACVKGENVLSKEPMSKDIARVMLSTSMTNLQANSSR